MDTEKAIRTYGKYYRTALEEAGVTDVGQKMAAFESRLRGMYAFEKYKKHNVYPTSDATYIYAVIAMCLEVKSFGYSDMRMRRFRGKVAVTVVRQYRSDRYR